MQIKTVHAPRPARSAAHGRFFAVERAAGRDIGQAPMPRYVTASLHVDFLRPTPHGPELTLTGRAVEIAGRKVKVEVEVTTGSLLTARGLVVAVAMPDSMRAAGG